jgi:hypothetical protein
MGLRLTPKGHRRINNQLLVLCYSIQPSVFFPKYNFLVIINSDLSNIKKWSEDWLITFNPDKTDIMLFDSRRQGNRSSLDNDTRNTTTFDTFKINLKSKVILAKIPAHFLNSMGLRLTPKGHRRINNQLLVLCYSIQPSVFFPKYNFLVIILRCRHSHHISLVYRLDL